MSLVLDILEDLYNNTSLSYKGIRVNIFGIPKGGERNKSRISVFGNTISRLNKKGFIKNDHGNWSITNLGKQYFDKNRVVFKKFDSPFDKKSPRNLILMFDIPESKKAERSWLRWQLKKFGYLMVQKSVWVGPSPLPKEFKDYVKEIGINDCLKTFKLAKDYKFK